MVRKIIVMVSACVLILSCMTVNAAETTAPTVSGGDVVNYTETAEMYADAAAVYAEAVETYAIALEVYQGTINTTYLQFYEDILNNVSVSTDYLLYRADQYTYTMLVGDIDRSGSVFSMSSGERYNITSVSGSGYGNSYYSYDVQQVNDVTVDVGDNLVYSNIGNYPDLIERSTYYDYATLYILIVFGLVFVIRSIFKFNYRTSK